MGDRGMYELEGCLIIPLAIDTLDNPTDLEGNILDRVVSRRLKRVIMDLSDVPVLDRASFASLIHLSRTLRMMGSGSIFVGFQPGAASALVELGVDTEEIRTAVTMEEGLNLLSRGGDPYGTGS